MRSVLSITCFLVTTSCIVEQPLPEHTDDGDSISDAGATPPAFATQVSTVYDELAATVRAERAFMCECEVVGTTQTVDECVAATLTVKPPPIVECIKGILGGDKRSLPPLECETRVAQNYVDCVQLSTCTDFEHILECQVTQMTETAKFCPTLPWDIWANIQEQCEGLDLPPPFTCQDETIINSEWVCDFEEDCPDGSDEIDCHF